MKHLSAIGLFCLLSVATSYAQGTLTCEPDSAFLASGALVDPSPYINDTLGDGLPDACLNTPYDLTIFCQPTNCICIRWRGDRCRFIYY